MRITLATDAKSVCIYEGGCGGAPKGSLQIQPLPANIRDAVSQTLVAAGFELVAAEAEPDMLANVEWRGTDTITLRLQDLHGRSIEGATFRRSLERCRELPRLTWDSCWAANFEHMKEELARPLRSSAALRVFAQKTNGSSVANVEAPSRVPEKAGESPVADAGSAPAGGSRVEAQQVEETIARHREELRRTCWQPAFEARDPQAPNAARVATTLRVATSGIVEQVTIGAEPAGYPQLAACIASQVRAWRFPPAQTPGTFSVPFVFAGD